MFIVKLHRLYAALELLASKFSDTEAAFGTVWTDIENVIATKSFADIKQTISDAENLYSTFIANYKGSADEIKAFLTDLHDLFAR